MNEILTNLICAVICGFIAWLVKTTIPYIKAKLQSTQYSWAWRLLNIR